MSPTDATKSPLAIGFRVARAVSGLSVGELAAKARTQPQTVRKLEGGEVPEMPQLVRIADALAAGTDK